MNVSFWCFKGLSRKQNTTPTSKGQCANHGNKGASPFGTLAVSPQVPTNARVESSFFSPIVLFRNRRFSQGFGLVEEIQMGAENQGTARTMFFGLVPLFSNKHCLQNPKTGVAFASKSDTTSTFHGQGVVRGSIRRVKASSCATSAGTRPYTGSTTSPWPLGRASATSYANGFCNRFPLASSKGNKKERPPLLFFLF